MLHEEKQILNLRRRTKDTAKGCKNNMCSFTSMNEDESVVLWTRKDTRCKPMIDCFFSKEKLLNIILSKYHREKEKQHVFFSISRWQWFSPGFPIDSSVVEIPSFDPVLATAAKIDDSDWPRTIRSFVSIFSRFEDKDVQQQEIFQHKRERRRQVGRKVRSRVVERSALVGHGGQHSCLGYVGGCNL